TGATAGGGGILGLMAGNGAAAKAITVIAVASAGAAGSIHMEHHAKHSTSTSSSRPERSRVAVAPASALTSQKGSSAAALGSMAGARPRDGKARGFTPTPGSSSDAGKAGGNGDAARDFALSRGKGHKYGLTKPHSGQGHGGSTGS